MNHRVIPAATLAWLCVLVAATGARPTAQAPKGGQVANGDLATYRQMVSRYCITCHNERLKIPAGRPLFLDRANLNDVSADADVWEKVIRKLGVGAMPPQGTAHPDAATLDHFRTWLADRLDAAQAAHPNPGRVLIHRLNRVEYANAVRDLLDLDVDVADQLPPDSASYGFDNVADVLTVPPSLLERYVTVASRLSAQAVGDLVMAPVTKKFPIPFELSQNQRMDGLPLGTRGGIAVRYHFPLDGEYVLGGQLFQALDNVDRGLAGQWAPEDFIITLDGQRVHEVQIGGADDDLAASKSMGDARIAAAARMRVRLPVKAGDHDLVFTFLMKSSAAAQDLFGPFERTSQDGNVGSGLPQLEAALITGPFSPTSRGDTASRQRIFACRPPSGDAPAEAACARQILTILAKRAYRRPLNDADLAPLLRFFDNGRRGKDFDSGIESALGLMLASPSFLFRTETDPASGNAIHRISDVELASRLSFFLWSSIPDEELLDAATKGTLSQPTVLRQQVRRMLASPKSDALVRNFTGQWLFLRNLVNVVPDLAQFPDFDRHIRDGARRETELLFDSVMREDRSVLDLLNADYTFVNERLAKYYGIPGVYGEEFRRVPVTDPNRRGLLGQASILMLTSHAARTSPTIRGKWIVSNLLGTPPLDPPPNVPALAENTAGTKPRTVRERLEEHRSNPVCAACHRNLDPVGFALENYDATGQWRAADSGQPVDSSGVLADGTKVDSPAALRDALLKRSDVFVGVLTERMLVYALGRGLEASDMPAVRRVVHEASKSGYRFSEIVDGIVRSVPFEMREREKVSDTVPVARGSAR